MEGKKTLLVCLLIVLCSVLFITSCGNTTASLNDVSNNSSESREDTSSDTEYISWANAKEHVGEYVSIQGKVVGTKYASDSNGKPTFLNIGLDHPDPDRFTVVIWGENRKHFSNDPESYYLGKEVIVTGVVELYNGSAEIVISSEDEISIR